LSVRVFGYHEVWHTFTVLAAGSHFAAIWLLTRG
jgi:predicted membrane channel-forming protein YqfA (hemolysin III family)